MSIFLSFLHSYTQECNGYFRGIVILVNGIAVSWVLKWKHEYLPKDKATITPSIETYKTAGAIHCIKTINTNENNIAIARAKQIDHFDPDTSSTIV